MELTRAKEEIYSTKLLRDIKTYGHQVSFGSEITCYNITSKKVIKIFDVDVDLSTKLLLPHNIYGNNTYVFLDNIIKCCNVIVAYTMQFVKGSNLSSYNAITQFYNLSYNTFLEFIETLLNDSKAEANYGIQVFDCYPTNIILSETGFRQIDCVDFKQKDIDPSIIEKENIRLMCIAIYESLMSRHLSTFISNNNLNHNDFFESPYEFIKELKNISQNFSDTEIITLNDTKKLARKK